MNREQQTTQAQWIAVIDPASSWGKCYGQFEDYDTAVGWLRRNEYTPAECLVLPVNGFDSARQCLGDATPPATPEPRELPRRCYVDQWTPAERAIQAAVAVVESMGADVRLSWAVSLLSDARRKVADFVDGVQVAIEDDEPSSVPEGTGATWQPPLRSPVSQPPATPEPPEGERAGERAIRLSMRQIAETIASDYEAQRDNDIHDEQRVQHIEALLSHATWRCFHCGMWLTNEVQAREHFGPAAGSGTVCALLGMKLSDVQRIIRSQPPAASGDVERRTVKLGVIEFHSDRVNPGLRQRFHAVTEDLRAAAAIVDLWLLDIATVLREFGYEMTVTTTKPPVVGDHPTPGGTK